MEKTLSIEEKKAAIREALDMELEEKIGDLQTHYEMDLESLDQVSEEEINFTYHYYTGELVKYSYGEIKETPHGVRMQRFREAVGEWIRHLVNDHEVEDIPSDMIPRFETSFVTYHEPTIEEERKNNTPPWFEVELCNGLGHTLATYRSAFAALAWERNGHRIRESSLFSTTTPCTLECNTVLPPFLMGQR